MKGNNPHGNHRFTYRSWLRSVGIGVGLIFAAYMTSVARQPESQKTLQPMLFLGFALVEALAVLGLVLAFIQ